MAGETPGALWNRESEICNWPDGRAEDAKMSRSFPKYGACPQFPLMVFHFALPLFSFQTYLPVLSMKPYSPPAFTNASP